MKVLKIILIILLILCLPVGVYFFMRKKNQKITETLAESLAPAVQSVPQEYSVLPDLPLEQITPTIKVVRDGNIAEIPQDILVRENVNWVGLEQPAELNVLIKTSDLGGGFVGKLFEQNITSKL